jgi:formylglycine-generating enzyme
MKKELITKKLIMAGLFLFALSLPISFVPAQLGIALSVIGWLAEGLLNRNWMVKWNPIFIPLLFYLCWNLLVSILSERPMHSLCAVLDNEWPVLIMCLMFWCVQETKILQQLLHTFFFSAAIAIVYALWQISSGVEIYRNMPLAPIGPFFRSVGFYGSSLMFAAFAITVFFLAMSYAMKVEKNKWSYVVITILSGLAVLGSFSRSIWLSIILLLPLFSFSRSKKNEFILSIGILLFIFILLFSVFSIRERASSIFDLERNETRINLWQTAIVMWEDSPILGRGEDNWDIAFDRFRTDRYYDSTDHPHNDYLTILVASGLPGLTAFLIMWGLALHSGYRTTFFSTDSKLQAPALGASFALTGFLIGAFFQNYYGTFINCLLWWFVVGIILTAEGLSNSRSKNRDINTFPEEKSRIKDVHDFEQQLSSNYKNTESDKQNREAYFVFGILFITLTGIIIIPFIDNVKQRRMQFNAQEYSISSNHSNRNILPQSSSSQPGTNGLRRDIEGKVNVTKDKLHIDSLRQGMVYVEGGVYQIGSSDGVGDNDEHSSHMVRVDSFYIDSFEVTVVEYRKFCIAMGRSMPPQPGFSGDNHPVVRVSWDDANAYACWKGKRLPSEAEWEIAAGGRHDHGIKYSGSNQIDDVGWYYYNSDNRTHPVGTKKGNDLGIYDMTGNVWEWCNDWYDENYYSNSPINSPQGPSSGECRVVRGGSWYVVEKFCRISNRYSLNPAYRSNSLGFRCALNAK